MAGRGILLVALSCLATAWADDGLKYPETKRVAHTDDYHGTEVPDPYRWLEESVRTSADVQAWVEAQNELTFGYLAAHHAAQTA